MERYTPHVTARPEALEARPLGLPQRCPVTRSLQPGGTPLHAGGVRGLLFILEGGWGNCPVLKRLPQSCRGRAAWTLVGRHSAAPPVSPRGWRAGVPHAAPRGQKQVSRCSASIWLDALVPGRARSPRPSTLPGSTMLIGNFGREVSDRVRTLGAALRPLGATGIHQKGTRVLISIRAAADAAFVISLLSGSVAVLASRPCLYLSSPGSPAELTACHLPGLGGGLVRGLHQPLHPPAPVRWTPDPPCEPDLPPGSVLVLEKSLS